MGAGAGGAMPAGGVAGEDGAVAVSEDAGAQFGGTVIGFTVYAPGLPKSVASLPVVAVWEAACKAFILATASGLGWISPALGDQAASEPADSGFIIVSADIHAMTGSVCRVAATKFYEVVDASLTPKQYVARCDKHKFDRRQRKDWNDIPESVYLVAEVMES